MTDKEIVELFRRRSEAALAEAAAKYGRYCRYIADNLLSPEDAADCVNETWLAAWNSIPPHAPENLKTYLGKLTRRIAVSRYRENHAARRCPGEATVSLDELDDIAADDDFTAKADAESLSRAISEFLRTLPESGRRMMVLRYWYNAPVREIAGRFSCSEGKVKVTLHRLRRKLAAYLRKEGFMT